MLANGQALRYGIGVGRDGFRWKRNPPHYREEGMAELDAAAQMLRRRPDLPRHMVGGVDNPLGARAIYLGSTPIVSTAPTSPRRLDRRCPPACFRMTNEDVTDLYSRVSVGTPVIVKN